MFAYAYLKPFCVIEVGDGASNNPSKFMYDRC